MVVFGSLASFFECLNRREGLHLLCNNNCKSLYFISYLALTMLYPSPTIPYGSRTTRHNPHSSTSTIPTDFYEDSNSSDSEASESSGPYSEVYESTRKLSSSLYNHAQSTTRNPHLTVVDDLLDTTINMTCRSRIATHCPSPDSREINQRAARNNVVLGRDMSVHESSHETSMEGLTPFLTPRQQLEALRSREKVLVIERWKELWGEVRPPVRAWYEMRGTGFNGEARRCRDLVGSVKRQEVEASVRDNLMDLYRSAVMDHQMTRRSFVDL